MAISVKKEILLEYSGSKLQYVTVGICRLQQLTQLKALNLVLNLHLLMTQTSCFISILFNGNTFEVFCIFVHLLPLFEFSYVNNHKERHDKEEKTPKA